VIERNDLIESEEQSSGDTLGASASEGSGEQREAGGCTTESVTEQASVTLSGQAAGEIVSEGGPAPEVAACPKVKSAVAAKRATNAKAPSKAKAKAKSGANTEAALDVDAPTKVKAKPKVKTSAKAKPPVSRKLSPLSSVHPGA